MNHIVDQAMAFARAFFEGDSGGHGFDHTLRVYRLALRIAKDEHADETIVSLAALLHDVDDRKLSPETSAALTNAATFLNEAGADGETAARVLAIIRETAFAGKDSVRPATAEGRCVQDADRLDAIGAIGIARAFAYGGRAGRPIYDPDVAPKADLTREEYYASRSHTVAHFYEKLLLLRDMMTTRTGRRLAEGRHAFMTAYLDEFFAEWDGQR